jgi:uncharacterized protein (DUF1778 family)
MRRLSIDITLEQHQHLKAIAALRGKSIKEYVLERVLPSQEAENSSEQETLQQLEAFLQPRLAAAEKGEISVKSVEQIFNEVRNERK